MSFAVPFRMSKPVSPVYSMMPIASAISRARASSLRLCSDSSGPSKMLTAQSIPNTFFSSYSKEIEANFISIKALGSHFERSDCLPILDFGSQRICNECLRTTRLPNAQTKSTRPRPLWLTKLHGCGAFRVVVSHVIDPRAHGIAPHEPSIVGLEQFGRRSRVPHPRIEPQVVAVWVEDDGHAVVDG